MKEFEKTHPAGGDGSDDEEAKEATSEIRFLGVRPPSRPTSTRSGSAPPGIEEDPDGLLNAINLLNIHDPWCSIPMLDLADPDDLTMVLDEIQPPSYSEATMAPPPAGAPADVPTAVVRLDNAPGGQEATL